MTGPVEPRFAVEFLRLDLTVPSGDGGYGRSEAPLSEVIRRTLASREAQAPIAVWLYSASEKELSEACDAHLRADWRAALAMDRFVRYRVNVDSIRREDLRESLRAPAYVFFDPAGEEIVRVEGKRAADCDSFDRTIEKAWRTVFDQSRKRYVKAMEDLLGQKEEIAGKRARIDEKRDEIVDDRNRQKKWRELDLEERELDRELEKILAAERKTRSSLELREEYRKEG